MDSPLNTESDPDLESLEAIIATFMVLLDDTTKTRYDIKAEVYRLKLTHENTFGCYAKFWLTLALGTELSEPYHVYGCVAASYRGIAIRKMGYSDTLLIEHYEQVVEHHSRRAAGPEAPHNPDLRQRHRIASRHAKDRLRELQHQPASL